MNTKISEEYTGSVLGLKMEGKEGRCSSKILAPTSCTTTQCHNQMTNADTYLLNYTVSPQRTISITGTTVRTSNLIITTLPYSVIMAVNKIKPGKLLHWVLSTCNSTTPLDPQQKNTQICELLEIFLVSLIPRDWNRSSY